MNALEIGTSAIPIFLVCFVSIVLNAVGKTDCLRTFFYYSLGLCLYGLSNWTGQSFWYVFLTLVDIFVDFTGHQAQ